MGSRSLVDATAVAGVLVVGLLTSGCSATPDPTATSTPTTTLSPVESLSPTASSASGSATVAVPEYPAAATRNDLDGQEAFVRYWIDAYNYAWKTGDLAPVKAVSQLDPENDALWGEIQVLYAAGGRQVGGDCRLLDIVAVPAGPSGITTPTVTTEFEAATQYDSQGVATQVAAVPAEPVGMTLQFREGRWYFFGFGTVADSHG